MHERNICRRIHEHSGVRSKGIPKSHDFRNGRQAVALGNDALQRGGMGRLLLVQFVHFDELVQLGNRKHFANISTGVKELNSQRQTWNACQ